MLINIQSYAPVDFENTNCKLLKFHPANSNDTLLCVDVVKKNESEIL